MALPLVSNDWPRYGRVWTFPLFTLFSFGILLAGCSNTCFVFISNPPTGTINIKTGDSKSGCMLATTNGDVRVLTQTVSTCSSCSASSQIANMFVSLRGIKIHPIATADDALLNWQELMPKLPDQAMQFDLVSEATSWGARLPLGEGIPIPADTYRQLRWRFVPNQPSSDDHVPDENACGAMGFNCVVLEGEYARSRET